MTGPRWFFVNLVETRLTQEQGDGRMSVVEFRGPPGDMPPLHVHRTDDEAWCVLEGEMSFFVEGQRPVSVAAGGVAFGPRGVPHTYRVDSATARWLAVCTPGDFERFVVAASRPAERPELPPPHEPPSEEEMAAFGALAAKHGIDLLGPPGALPASA